MTAPAPETTTSAPKDGQEDKKDPVVIICIGMAGSVSSTFISHKLGSAKQCLIILLLLQGKTTLMQRLNSYLHSQNKPPYILNLDPAVTHMPYEANIDIRDTVDYKEVMKQ